MSSVSERLALGWTDEQFEAELAAIDEVSTLIEARDYQAAKALQEKYVEAGVILRPSGSQA
jgi:hypothetical protein